MDELRPHSRELQADALLLAAETYQKELLTVAVRLAGGSKEGGMDLFQQTVLNCHDAIQRRGFDEGRGQYRFYLLRSLRNLAYKQTKQPQPLTLEEVPEPAGTLDTGEVTPYQELAEQLAQEVREQFSYSDRVALRLYLDGMSCQQIAEHIGKKDQSWVWRRIERIKKHLYQTFWQNYAALSE